jgi:hypothetical protein
VNIFYHPEKDSTIYSQTALRELNFGKSEILELKNAWSMGAGSDTSRILLQFNIPFNLENYQDFNHLKFYLELKITHSEELTDSTTISAFPISDYWQEGIGIGFDADPVYQPVNWTHKTDSEMWSAAPTPTPTPTPTPAPDPMSGGYDSLCVTNTEILENGHEQDAKGTYLWDADNRWFANDNQYSIFKMDNTRWVLGSTIPTGAGISVAILTGELPTSQSWSPAISVSGEGCVGLSSPTPTPTPSAGPQASGRVFASKDENGGGSYYTHIERCDQTKTPISASYKFSQKTSDVNLDVTEIVKCWMLGDIPNNGLLIKFAQEGRSERNQSIKFYSGNTNTIYSPRLRAAYFDYISVAGGENSMGSGSLSGSLQELKIPSTPMTEEELGTQSDEKIIVGSCEQTFAQPDVVTKPTPTLVGDITVKIKTIRKKYFNNEQIRFNVSARSKHPTKTFSNKATYSGDSVVGYDMFYSIRDAETNEVLINFDEYSRISNDAKGHFFALDLSGLHVGRFYKFYLLVSGDNGNEIFEDNRSFEIGS